MGVLNLTYCRSGGQEQMRQCKLATAYLARPCSESSVKPLHDAGDVYKAQKPDVELVKAGRHASKDLHALEEVFNQMAGFVALLVQGALLFAVDLGGDDDLHALILGALHNLV